MTTREPNIQIHVDITNPGQFFACCGLLELADRLWPDDQVEGWFIENDFLIRCPGTLVDLIQTLLNAGINSSLTDAQLKRLGTLLSANKANLTQDEAAEKALLSERWKQERLLIPAPFNLDLDWWSDDETGGKTLKTWAAKQLVLGMARSMFDAMRQKEWFASIGPNVLASMADVSGVPFYFDSDSNTQSTARDVGFSLYGLRNKVKTQECTRPLLELAAFVGIQRFRPAYDSKTKVLYYCVWPCPLPITAAGVAANGVLKFPSMRSYVFRMLFRTEYMKAFLPAQPYQGN